MTVTVRPNPVERPALRAIVATACMWEAAAIVTRRMPTVSAGMWRIPTPYRAALWGLVAVGLTDHFITRRFL